MADDEQDDLEPDDAGSDDDAALERVSPEVVSDTAPAPVPGPTERVTLYRMVRIGLSLLVAIGALVAISGVRLFTDPDGFVCDSARSIIEDELDEDEADRDPAVADVDPDAVDDMPCADALTTANAVSDDVPDEGTATSLGIGALVAGVLMISAGGYALFVRTRRSRTIALAIAAIGIIPSTLFGLGLIGLAVMGFVVYAIGFSRDAKAAFGVVGGSRAGGAPGGLFRPRTPPPAQSE